MEINKTKYRLLINPDLVKISYFKIWAGVRCCLASTWFINQKLIKIVIILSFFQGYVCPGILVTLTDGDNVKVLEECWHRHTLISPSGFKIYRLGLSGGCSVTPFNQVHKHRKLEGDCSEPGIKDGYQVSVYVGLMIYLAF